MFQEEEKIAQKLQDKYRDEKKKRSVWSVGESGRRGGRDIQGPGTREQDLGIQVTIRFNSPRKGLGVSGSSGAISNSTSFHSQE